ncbi:IPIL1 protein, partial [Psilopogon haemacephalus]|nr:IPIL1 protein [Psilopogon haemacephalus]
EELVGELIRACRDFFSVTVFPALQAPIGVGSAFEGWSPHGDDAVYHLLVPLKAPYGHAFSLEESIAGEKPARNFCIRVQLKCSCVREELVENMPCFLHHPEAEMRRHPSSHLLGFLCSDSYLDAHKTLKWFQNFVRAAWGVLPKTHPYRMKMLPSTGSCKLQLTDRLGRAFFIEIFFGLQQDDSDIFLCSCSKEATLTTSTTWSGSCAVAEVKFFQHIARQVPLDSYHLQCLHVCTQNLSGKGFSASVLKAAVMHLLTSTPLAGWCRRESVLRLKDILQYLKRCLEEKRLNHFFTGNDNVPREISLPFSYRMAEPLNLFQHLLQDKAAQARALCELEESYNKLLRL